MRWHSWMAPALGAFAAVFCYAPFLYLKEFDLEQILYALSLFVLTLILIVVVVLRRIFARRWVNRTTVFTVLAFLAATFILLVRTDYLRPWARWLVSSQQYKNQVMQQAIDPKTGLRFVVWDGWGMFAQDTDVFLLYDPTDELGDALHRQRPGRFAALEQHVWFYERLERGWYSVTFYTNDPWGPDE